MIHDIRSSTLRQLYTFILHMVWRTKANPCFIFVWDNRRTKRSRMSRRNDKLWKLAQNILVLWVLSCRMSNGYMGRSAVVNNLIKFLFLGRYHRHNKILRVWWTEMTLRRSYKQTQKDNWRIWNKSGSNFFFHLRLGHRHGTTACWCLFSSIMIRVQVVLLFFVIHQPLSWLEKEKMKN